MAIAFVQDVTTTTANFLLTGTCTLPAAPAAGNLLVFASGMDKGVARLFLPGFNEICSLDSISVSLFFYWRMSRGTEKIITPSWDVGPPAGCTLWYAEYADAALKTTDQTFWYIVGKAFLKTDEAITFTHSCGWTGPLAADGMGIAVDAIDSGQSVTAGAAFDNGYFLRHDSTTGGSGRGAIFVGEKLEPAGPGTSSNFSYTTVTADQNSGAIAVFAKSNSPVPLGAYQ